MFFFFFFNDTATTEIYTLSLHDALPIYPSGRWGPCCSQVPTGTRRRGSRSNAARTSSGTRVFKRSEEHTSELQSRLHLVCRLLLEKKKKKTRTLEYYKKQRNHKIQQSKH